MTRYRVPHHKVFYSMAFQTFHTVLRTHNVKAGIVNKILYGTSNQQLINFCVALVQANEGQINKY